MARIACLRQRYRVYKQLVANRSGDVPDDGRQEKSGSGRAVNDPRALFCWQEPGDIGERAVFKMCFQISFSPQHAAAVFPLAHGLPSLVSKRGRK